MGLAGNCYLAHYGLAFAVAMVQEFEVLSFVLIYQDQYSLTGNIPQLALGVPQVLLSQVQPHYS